MKRPIRYSLIITGAIYASFALCSLYIAYVTYKYPPTYGSGFGVFFSKVWNGSLFLFNLLLYYASVLNAYLHLRGQTRLWWAFLWAFLLHGLIGMWFIIPVCCYAYLCRYTREWYRKKYHIQTMKYMVFFIFSILCWFCIHNVVKY